MCRSGCDSRVRKTSRSSGFTPFPLVRCWPSAGWCRRLRLLSPDTACSISTTTRTGQGLARARFGAERVFYCPLDLPWAVRAYLNALKPRMLILAETEFWPNLLNGCFRRDIPVAVVNARISDRSWPRYQMLRRLWRPILGRLSRVLAQTKTDAERLIALGCPPELVNVSGNLEIRCARSQAGGGDATSESPRERVFVFLLRAALSMAKKRPCSKHGHACLPLIPACHGTRPAPSGTLCSRGGSSA